jgi:ADP-heptose:LPS heptosyltransferase
MLQIHDRRERAFVAAADRMLAAAVAAARPFRTRVPPGLPRRILLLRLERIGDLLMALPAIADVRAAAPEARVELVVGSWNRGVASAVPGVDDVQVLDARWLARETGGLGVGRLLATARRWRAAEYDLAINFEPDVRSNLLLAASGAHWTAGYRSGGGGALLDQALEYDPTAHTIDNARRLVATVFRREIGATRKPWLRLPDAARAAAETRLAGRGATPLVGIHVSGGRAIKQWPPERFAEVARELASCDNAAIVLTGTAADRPMVQTLKARIPADRTLDVSGEPDLLTVAALLQRIDLLITGDTGPMHLAGAVGTPVVAVFGPSDPARYEPRGPLDRVVRIDLPCSPCNRIRLPPARCTGHTPDCLAGVPVARVLAAAREVLVARRAGLGGRRGREGARP